MALNPRIEDKTLTYKDVVELSKLVKTDYELEKVIDYLKSNNLKISIKGCYDSQSGWTGRNIYLQGVDLSGNGYCYSNEKLMRHIDEYPKFLEVKNTTEYKQYLELKKKFEKFERLF